MLIATFDFETYSAAGFVWNSMIEKYQCLPGASKKGLPAINVARYSEHESTEVLSLAYRLPNDTAITLWLPGNAPPKDLFEYLNSGGLIEGWNVSFEFYIWQNVCVKKYGWPTLNVNQLRCAMAKSRAFSLPGALGNCGEVLNINAKKDKDGARLLTKFSMPRNPTKTNKSHRNLLSLGDEDTHKLYSYNIRDVEAEEEISAKIPELSDFELKFWQCDQAINRRGIKLDIENIKNCIVTMNAAYTKYNNELQKITNGDVSSASEVAKIIRWVNAQNSDVYLRDLRAETLEKFNDEKIEKNYPENICRVVELREILSSAAVKKTYTMLNQVCADERLRDLFIYYSARTGRAAGAGVQPQNLPNSGETLTQCDRCEGIFKSTLLENVCPWCLEPTKFIKKEWDIDSVESALDLLKSKNLKRVEHFLGDVAPIISGCLRSLFIADTNKDLICSDYSAIEAVVLAALAGEEWRMEIFRTHGMIYEISASKITGVPFEEFIRVKKETGQHHPLRKTIGKIAELASGYQGWIGAWKAFGAGKYFTDDRIKESILKWREASPAIVAFWGTQPTENNWWCGYSGIEGCVVKAIKFSGKSFVYRKIICRVSNDILYIRLLSGRNLIYHKPRLSAPQDPWRGEGISYEGWNSNPANGEKIGWTRLKTWGGKLVENIVQATARDILAYAIINLEQAGYPVVLHVHDEIVCEIPEYFGSVVEFERIMSTMPAWASSWPIKASGGWRGKRYRK